MVISHAYISNIANSTDTSLVRPTDWNAGHIVDVDLSTEVNNILPIANGGTGESTANDALNALLPDQTGNAGKILTTDGSDSSWSNSFIPNLVGGNGITYAAGTIDADINTTNLQFTATKINTIQDISTSSSPTFATITASTVDTNNLKLGGLDQSVPFLLTDAGITKPVATSGLFTYDYNAFILKVPDIRIDNAIVGTLMYIDSNKKLTSDALLVWDQANNKLGINATSATSNLDVNGTICSTGTQTLHYQIKNVTVASGSSRDLLVVRESNGDGTSSADDRMAWIQHNGVGNVNYWNFWGKNLNSSTAAVRMSVQYDNGDTYVNIGSAATVNSSVQLEIQRRGVLVQNDGSYYVNGIQSDPDYVRLHQNAALNVGLIDFSSEFWFRPDASAVMLAMTASGIRLGGSALDANYIFQLPNSATKKAKANAWDTYSDRDLKENISDMPSATAKLRALQPREFNYKAAYINDYDIEPASEPQGGFIAQEFAQQFPQYCSFDNTGVARAIDYSRLTADLTKGWQELDARIQALEGNP